MLLDPIETGSWLSVMLDNGTNKCQLTDNFLAIAIRVSTISAVRQSSNLFQMIKTSNSSKSNLHLAHLTNVILIVGSIALGSGCTGLRAKKERSATSLQVLDVSLSGFKTQFNQEVAKPRLLALLSPT